MARGDHIRTRRFLYSHHGIDAGDGDVIHYTGEPGRKKNACVAKTSIEEFADGGKIRLVEHEHPLSVEKTIEIAEEYLGEKKYHLAWNNCEHFAHYCKTGEKQSKQVQAILQTLLAFVGLTLSLIWHTRQRRR